MRILDNFSLRSSVLNSNGRNLFVSKRNVKNNKISNTVNISFGSTEELPDCARKVDETLYRGRRPSKYDFEPLKDLGIKTIIDLSTEPQDIDEGEYANKYGMKYVPIPINSAFETPRDEQLQEFFNVIKDVKDKNEKAYVHCLMGRDRTGLMVNLYKIYYDLPVSETFETEYARSILKDFLKRTKLL